MVRPVTYYLPLFVIVLMAYRAMRRRVTLRHGARMIAVFLLPVIVIIGGWQFRNHEAVNSWRFSAVEAKNLDLFRAAGVVADEETISLNAAQRRLIMQLGTHLARVKAPTSDACTDKACTYLPRNRGKQPKAPPRAFWTRSTALVPGPSRISECRRHQALSTTQTRSLLAVFYALLLYGLVQVIHARRHLFGHLFVVGVAAYVLLVSAGPEATDGRGERFRSVVMPILILYTARGIQELALHVRRHHRERRARPRHPTVGVYS